ncbi:hypothetical protein OEW28_14875 [Defluviimonas sp. WL0002]|uniref:Transposase n=1 Tax=Albidovulum marisflavi TaxID=2984159 RepID=A0ABT2ZFW1_9RHOB|nr:hypothetical protein [Defluviimonas sp. WL0002]MCV2869913.1 hypothetical protein [Defluviimonas sp. WL0002]
MHRDLSVQRRALSKSYRLYLDADRRWTVAVQETKSWFSGTTRPPTAFLGDPGSRVRRLYDARDRALQRLLVARGKLEEARRRLRDRKSSSGRTLYLIMSS